MIWHSEAMANDGKKINLSKQKSFNCGETTVQSLLIVFVLLVLG